MSSNLQNSIWPNEGGTLGQNKVQIPTGTDADTIKWPTGDALVGNFVFNKGKLVGFVDTKALIANSSKTTTFPYEYVNISLPSIAEGEMTYNHDQCAYFILNGEVLKGDIPTDEELEIITKKYAGCKTVDDIKAVDPNYLTNDIVNGVWKEGLGDLEIGGDIYENEGMFMNCSNLTSFSSDLSSLTNGSAMFAYCENLSEFDSDLSSLTNGQWMFQYCSKLTSFSIDMPSLTGGFEMFYSCSNLTSFSSDLSSLTNGYLMFSYCENLSEFDLDLSSLMNGDYMFNKCYNLTVFSSDLSSLMNGYGMFQYCTKLTSFSSDLSKLTDGSYMFNGCSSLTSFNADLSSLKIGEYMFQGCYNLESFSSDLSSLTDGNDMFVGCKLNTASVQHIANTINSHNGGLIEIYIGNSYPNEQETSAFNKMVDKGWIIYVNGSQFGSSCCSTCCASLTTLDETDGEFVAPIPFWAKPVPSDEEHAKYVDSEGNFYNILGAQFIYGDSLETYGMFTSLEDAQAQMRLKKIGEEEIETA